MARSTVTSLSSFTREESREVGDALLDFVRSERCALPLGAAMKEIFRDVNALERDRRIAADSEPCQVAFYTWCAFDRPVADEGSRLVDLFLKDDSFKVTRGQRRYLERMRASYLKPYEVLKVHVDRGIVLRDLWSDTIVNIGERSVTYWAQPRTMLFARLIDGPQGEPEMHSLLTFPRADVKEMLWYYRSFSRTRLKGKPEQTDRELFENLTPWILRAWLETFRTPPRVRHPLPGEAEKPKSKTRILQLKLSLERVRPQVWRRLIVPERITLPTLSKALERVMGWESHLHSFEFDGISYRNPDPDYPSDTRSEYGRRLSDFDLAKGSTFEYLYDFGDSWHHRIVVESIVEAEQGVRYPTCVDGARACPPEDVGGPGGYAEFRRVLQNHRHHEYEHFRQWSRRGRRDFDPEVFNLAEANRGLSARVLVPE
jgi:hypothetical protein